LRIVALDSRIRHASPESQVGTQTSQQKIENTSTHLILEYWTKIFLFARNLSRQKELERQLLPGKEFFSLQRRAGRDICRQAVYG